MDYRNIFDKWLRGVAIIVMMVGLSLIIEGFILDPTGQIHHSVLIYFGEVLIFMGAVPVIEHYTDLKDKNKDK